MNSTSSRRAVAHSIEILEARIAPAVFFVNGTNLTFTNAAGVVVAGDPAAAASCRHLI